MNPQQLVYNRNFTTPVSFYICRDTESGEDKLILQYSISVIFNAFYIEWAYARGHNFDYPREYYILTIIVLCMYWKVYMCMFWKISAERLITMLKVKPCIPFSETYVIFYIFTISGNLKNTNMNLFRYKSHYFSHL